VFDSERNNLAGRFFYLKLVDDIIAQWKLNSTKIDAWSNLHEFRYVKRSSG
jgi:hypothetical protein